MLAAVRRHPRALQICWNVGGLAIALLILSWGLRHGDPSVANVLLSILNLALLANIVTTQRRASRSLAARIEAQAASATRLEALCEVLEADYVQRRGRIPAYGASPASERILH